MISSARSALFLLLLASPCAAQAHRPEAQVPARLAAAVAGAAARQWVADSAKVRLEWGVIPAAAALSDSTPFSLTGKGADGWLIALFTPAKASPAAVRVRVGLLDSVTVAARPIARGATLAAADTRHEERVRWGVPALEMMPGEGWVTRRPLAAGDEITPSSATAPQVIKSGDQVRVEWQSGAVTVALDGVAMGSGSLGEMVSVRLAERKGQRRGKVMGPGSVRLES
jgi:flagellar basal body P-ring formation protein FlgA